MRRNVYLALPAAVFMLARLSAATVDRVAVVIDKKVVTESEVLDELRLTEFLNDQPLELGAKSRREAAERLVDQELIRRELEISGYAPPAASEADSLLRKFRQNRFHSLADYRAALQKYGIAEEQLKAHLLWQLTAIRFTDQRFRSQLPETGSQSADRSADDSPANSVDQQMDAWLKEARSNTKITFKQEAFQ
jgi:hypothetical protein